MTSSPSHVSMRNGKLLPCYTRLLSFKHELRGEVVFRKKAHYVIMTSSPDHVGMRNRSLLLLLTCLPSFKPELQHVGPRAEGRPLGPRAEDPKYPRSPTITFVAVILFILFQAPKNLFEMFVCHIVFFICRWASASMRIPGMSGKSQGVTHVESHRIWVQYFRVLSHSSKHPHKRTVATIAQNTHLAQMAV